MILFNGPQQTVVRDDVETSRRLRSLIRFIDHEIAELARQEDAIIDAVESHDRGFCDESVEGMPGIHQPGVEEEQHGNGATEFP